ncbi:hypothetical protein FDA94_28835 [Herbidospora galbida]|uniref:Uncharacterized protein n=1 Tax=Herbidospora galbida TaxID=2575442 RepID=A0A4U3M6S5_9ACTN|nr:hypothetical protein [Herbidospora galbida]TKK84638.1 hypothetical protein FDA94_28835 [Herbidospora galbida]
MRDLALAAAEARHELIVQYGSRDGVLDMMSQTGEFVTKGGKVYIMREAYEAAERLAKAYLQHLSLAQLVVIDDDVCQLLDLAAGSMPDQVLNRQMPLFPYGFAWFADPLIGRDIIVMDVEKEVPVRGTIPLEAMSWSYINGDHLITAATDCGPSMVLTTYARRSAVEAILDSVPGANTPVDEYADGLQSVSTTVWSFGTPTGTAFGKRLSELSHNLTIEELRESDMAFTQRLAAAIWALGKQPITSTEEEVLPRHMRRRAARIGVTESERPVQILKLRQKMPAKGPRTEGKRHVDWKSRWPVSLHWRKPRENQKIQEPTLIWPYIKGPEGLPIKGSRRTFVLDNPDGLTLEDLNAE